MYNIKNKLLEIEKSLIHNPKGFDLDDYYMCVICSKVVGAGDGWYDKLGPKCLLCQKAVDNKIIPSDVCISRNSWLAMWEIRQLGYHHAVVSMMIRKRQLKPRIIKDSLDKAYYYVFIKRENSIITKDSKTKK